MTLQDKLDGIEVVAEEVDAHPLLIEVAEERCVEGHAEHENDAEEIDLEEELRAEIADGLCYIALMVARRNVDHKHLLAARALDVAWRALEGD